MDVAEVSAPLGRDAECAALDRVIDQARDGHGSVLVLRGEPGVGKSVLLDYAAAHAAGFLVARTAGVESERELPLAGLQQLLDASLLERAATLAPPQRDALRVAFGLLEGPVPDPFLVALAALGVLSDAADERPLLCLVDDVQWLDKTSVQVLSFVARRLAAERLAIVFAVREPSGERVLDGLPQLALEGLSDHHARALLDSVVPGRLDQQVRDRIVAEARGNPLALLELPRGRSLAELAGGFGLPQEGVAGRVEASFMRRIEALPDATQRLLFVAAAEPTGDVTLLTRALAALEIAPDAIGAAETEGLIALEARVRFRHPLVRSAAYRTAPASMRRRIHAALAEASDPAVDPDRRAWHRAHASAVPDEAIAVELERSASRAQARGGLTAAAAFLERAAELTPDPGQRGTRVLAAAQAKFDAGAPDAAEALLGVASHLQLDALERARLDRLRARIAFTRTRGSDTPALLSAAARRLEPLDPELARETHLEALGAAVRSGRFARAEGVLEAADAAAASGSPRSADLLLRGLTTRLARGYGPSLPSVAHALDVFQKEGFRRENIAWCWIACQLAMDSWNDDACAAIAGGLTTTARERGALGVLPFALNYSAAHQLFAGAFGACEQLLEEADTIATATSSVPIADFAVLLAAWRGDRERTYALREAAIARGIERGEGFAVEVAEWAIATLHLGYGEYDEAQASAQRAYDHDGLGFDVCVLPELIEAAVRSGDRAAAELAFARLEERSSLSATPWARGIEALSRALLREDDALFREAIEQLGRSKILIHHARAHLVYGQWLRRVGRRDDARAQLKAAHSALDAMGAAAFAERARRELAATGETVPKRRAGRNEIRDALTPQEAQIARMARKGMTNPEIGGQLFLSHRTVEWHMRKILGKLGITSRRELADALPWPEIELVPAP